MTLISQRSGSGEERRCDAKCYDATHAECDCVCGGLNHGAGRDLAVQQTTELAGRILAAGEKRELAFPVLDDHPALNLKAWGQGNLFCSPVRI